jgi:hypothetical protein
MADKELTYMALLRESEGFEVAVTFVNSTGEETSVGDEITVQGVGWRVLAVRPEEPPWAGTLVCERAAEVMSASERPSCLEDDPPDVMSASERPSSLEDDLPLHLLVFRAIVDGQAPLERIDQALALANEVYELE